MSKERTTSHNIVMKNRPGELVKLTRFLTDASINVSGLRVDNLGDNAAVRFTTAKGCVLPETFNKNR